MKMGLREDFDLLIDSSNHPSLSLQIGNLPTPPFVEGVPTKVELVSDVNDFVVSNAAESMCQRDSLLVCLASSSPVWYRDLGSKKATSSPRSPSMPSNTT